MGWQHSRKQQQEEDLDLAVPGHAGPPAYYRLRMCLVS